MNDQKIKRTKRHIIEMTDSEHTELKVRAAKQGITVREWLMGAIVLRIEVEKNKTSQVV